MNRFLSCLAIGAVLATCLPCMVLLAGEVQAGKPAPELTESEARKILSDSPWAKRSKLRSTIKPDTNFQAPEIGPQRPGGLPPGGRPAPPSPSERFDQITAGPQPIPCAGWGFGTLSLPSPTSEECKAAWQSVSAIKSSGLPKSTAIILWESAAPVREAKARLAISDLASAQATDAVIISVIAHPSMGQLNSNAPSARKLVRDSAVLLRNGRDRVLASDVAFIETAETVVRFFFPRQKAIQAGDKEFIFRFEIIGTLVEARFDLRQTVYKGSTAL